MAEMHDAMMEKLVSVRKTNLEAQMIELLAERKGLSIQEALNLYYSSDLSHKIETNEYGLQYLDANYLVDELLRP